MGVVLHLVYFVCAACDVLPVLLRGTVAVTSHAQFLAWLEKAIEFFVCYVAQSLPEDSGMFCEKMQTSLMQPACFYFPGLILLAWLLSTTDLAIPDVSHATIISRTFVSSATSAWNSSSCRTRSSASLSVFRSHLKTELFQLSYS